MTLYAAKCQSKTIPNIFHWRCFSVFESERRQSALSHLKQWSRISVLGLTGLFRRKNKTVAKVLTFSFHTEMVGTHCLQCDQPPRVATAFRCRLQHNLIIPRRSLQELQPFSTVSVKITFSPETIRSVPPRRLDYNETEWLNRYISLALALGGTDSRAAGMGRDGQWHVQ